MDHANLNIIASFFEAYGKRDLETLGKVLGNNARWIFPGQNPFSGVKNGIAGIVDFFDQMGAVMGSSAITMERLVTGVNDTHVSECQHLRTNRTDGNNMEQYWCVLWTFENGRIVEGRHLASDQQAADRFFSALAGR